MSINFETFREEDLVMPLCSTGKLLLMQLEPFEENCSMRDLELAAVVIALKT